MKFSDCKFDSELTELQSEIIPVAVSEQAFMFDVKERLAQNVAKAAGINIRTTRLSVKHKAFLLIPAYTMIMHKSQGQTLGKIIIGLVMSPGPTELASICVLLSRVKRFDDLLIICPFEFATIQVKLSKAQMEELKQLDLRVQKTRNYFLLSV